MAAEETDPVLLLEKQLNKELKDFRYAGPLQGLLIKLSTTSGARFDVQWEQLERLGVNEETRVVMRVGRAAVRQVLDLALAQVAPKGRPLAWKAEGGLVRISSQQALLNGTAARRSSPPRSTSATRGRTTPRVATNAIDLDEIALEEAVEFFRRVSDANINVNWNSLAALGIEKTTPVTIKANNITIARALTLLTDQLSSSPDRLQRVYWLVDGGVVRIASGDALNRDLRTKVVDVGDLLVVVPNFEGPRLNLTSNDRDDDDSGNSFWGSDDDDDDDTSTDETASIAEQRQAKRQALMDIVKNSIGEDMWQPTGRGSIRMLGNKMIISQTLLGFKLMEESGR
jgi:hypothetical protein